MPDVKNTKTFAPEVVFKDYMDVTKGRTKNPWNYDPIPEEVKNSPVEFYIYNVGPYMKVINSGGLGKQKVQACPDGEKYSKPIEIHKWVIDHADMGEYNMKTILIEGKDRVREMVSPNNDPETDLRKWGIFYSKNNPPSQAEIDDANRRLRDTMNQIVKYGDFLYTATNGQGGTRRGEITAVYMTAAKWLGVERPWYSVSEKLNPCPGCGDNVKPNIRKHTACGWRFDLNRFEGDTAPSAPQSKE